MKGQFCLKVNCTIESASIWFPYRHEFVGSLPQITDVGGHLPDTDPYNDSQPSMSFPTPPVPHAPPIQTYHRRASSNIVQTSLAQLAAVTYVAISVSSFPSRHYFCLAFSSTGCAASSATPNTLNADLAPRWHHSTPTSHGWHCKVSNTKSFFICY